MLNRHLRLRDRRFKRFLDESKLSRHLREALAALVSDRLLSVARARDDRTRLQSPRDTLDDA